MDLSILIPIYRWDCRQLISDLNQQAQALGISYEILQANDEELRLGRASIRNYLAEQAKGDRLLFIDCDAAVDNPAFLSTYMKHADEAPVICGGLHHADQLPSPDVSLRYAYEKHADRQRGAVYRRQHPYARFTPFNLLILRDLFLRIRFNEDVKEYGHEDTLFGAELERRKIPILHIDNPLLHEGLESNEHFMEKTRTALRTLKQYEQQLANYSSLVAIRAKLRQMHLDKLVGQLFLHWRPRIEHRLCFSLHPSLILFKIYKLGFYCQL